MGKIHVRPGLQPFCPEQSGASVPAPQLPSWGRTGWLLQGRMFLIDQQVPGSHWEQSKVTGVTRDHKGTSRLPLHAQGREMTIHGFLLPRTEGANWSWFSIKASGFQSLVCWKMIPIIKCWKNNRRTNTQEGNCHPHCYENKTPLQATPTPATIRRKQFMENRSQIFGGVQTQLK